MRGSKLRGFVLVPGCSFELSVCLSVSHLVSESLPAVLEHFETLLRLSASRRAALEDQLRLYVFEREAKELQTWLSSRKTVAESEDCGQDLEDVEVRMRFENVCVVGGLSRSLFHL